MVDEQDRIDTDEMTQNVASDLGLQWLSFSQSKYLW